MKRHREMGFTLLETMMVLAGFFLLISLSFLLIRPQTETLETKQFFSQLQADLFYAQQYAITKQVMVAMQFEPEDSYYFIMERPGSAKILERTYSENIRAMEGTTKLLLQFRSNGNISSPGTIIFYIGDKRYQLIFQLGRGRFYLAEF